MIRFPAPPLYIAIHGRPDGGFNVGTDSLDPSQTP